MIRKAGPDDQKGGGLNYEVLQDMSERMLGVRTQQEAVNQGFLPVLSDEKSIKIKPSN
ncbi:hypothetical protein [Macrococcus carouselicus]|nr:hypothetical protein [Macrococcus carouselicus]